MKNVAVLVTGTLEIYEMEISPETTASEIMDSLNLEGYRLHGREAGSLRVFRPTEPLYESVEDGQNLKAVPEPGWPKFKSSGGDLDEGSSGSGNRSR